MKARSSSPTGTARRRVARVLLVLAVWLLVCAGLGLFVWGLGPQTSFGVSVIAVFGLLVGIQFLLSGWHGERVGTMPHCRRCDYAVASLTRDRCPECGLELSAGNVVQGERKRRWGRMAVGAVVLAVLSLPTVASLALVPWYQYNPAVFVVLDLDVPAKYPKAIAELQRRGAAGSLSQSAWRTLVDKALQEQVAMGTAPRRELLDCLGLAYLRGHMTDQQKQKFIDQTCEVTMVVRPVVAEGDTVPFLLVQREHGPRWRPPRGFWEHYNFGQHRVDGRVVGSGRGEGSADLSGTGDISSSEPAGAIGSHTMEADTEWTIWYGPEGDPSTSRRVGARKTTAKATYDVVPRDVAPAIQMLGADTLREQVRASVRLLSFMYDPENGSARVAILLRRPPCDLAFDVLLQTAHGETSLGSIYCPKGQSFACELGGEGRISLPPQAKVILRSSAEVARTTVDEWAIYSGEIVFPYVVRSAFGMAGEAAQAEDCGNRCDGGGEALEATNGGQVYDGAQGARGLGD